MKRKTFLSLLDNRDNFITIVGLTFNMNLSKVKNDVNVTIMIYNFDDYSDFIILGT